MKENTENNVKRFIRVPDVLNRVGFSRTTLYERIKEGNFPDRVKIGPRCVAFVESEIDEWIEESEIFQYLDKRRKVLDGICITGGEPSLYSAEIVEFVRKVKERYGYDFLVKIEDRI